MIASAISRISALVLGVAGFALLFASDLLVPALVRSYPPSAAWFAQMLAAAWLGVAALNWLQRSARLGGIYGRPIVLANLALYFITATSILRPLLAGTAPNVAWIAFAVAAALSIGYGALLLRGPFD